MKGAICKIYYYLKYEKCFRKLTKYYLAYSARQQRNESLLKTLMRFVADVFRMLASEQLAHPVLKYHFVHSDDDSN